MTVTLNSTFPNPGDVILNNNSTWKGNGKIFVEGDWNNNATFQQDLSTVTMFASTVQQTITGTVPTTFHNLILTGAGEDKIVECSGNGAGNGLLHGGSEHGHGAQVLLKSGVVVPVAFHKNLPVTLPGGVVIQDHITGIGECAVEGNRHGSVVIDQAVADGAVVLNTAIDLYDRLRGGVDLRTVVEEYLRPCSERNAAQKNKSRKTFRQHR